MSAQGGHAQGVNPLVSVVLYSIFIVQIVLYGSELWNTITNADMSVFHDSNIKQKNDHKVNLCTLDPIGRNPWSD